METDNKLNVCYIGMHVMDDFVGVCMNVLCFTNAAFGCHNSINVT